MCLVVYRVQFLRDCFVDGCFQYGPLALVRISGGSFGSPSPGALGPVEIVSSYLSHNLYNKVKLLDYILTIIYQLYTKSNSKLYQNNFNNSR